MKTLGLIGGTSWVSTVDYYRIINQTVSKRLGGLNSAKLLLYSLNLAEIVPLAEAGKWDQIAQIFGAAAKTLERAGAECVVFAANTPHRIAGDVRKMIGIPLIHIAEVTADEIARHKMTKVALLGTRFTMQEVFFKDILSERGIESLIPGDDDIAFMHHTILYELGKDIFTAETKQRYISIIEGLAQTGAQGVIFACTEIPLLLKQEDCSIPVFDTTLLHTTAAADFALGA
jgi:aspartate racemase